MENRVWKKFPGWRSRCTAKACPIRESGRYGGRVGAFVYYRSRYYSPQTGRFISEDPIGWASGQTNAYAYVGGNPVQFTDPAGLQAIPIPMPPPPAGPGCSPGSGGVPDWFNGMFSNGDADDPVVYPNNPQESPGSFEPIRGTRGKKVLMMVLFGRKTRRAMAETNGSAGRTRKTGAKEGRQIVFGLMDAFENERGRNGVVQIQ
jgi:RHS repeat-associated protein